MRIIAKNVGVIKNADIKLNGITVIAGKNGTGKSTLGKVLYCIGRTLYDAEDNVREEKARQISMVFNSRLFAHFGVTRVRISRQHLYEMIDHYNITGEIKYPEKIDEMIQASESREEIEKMISEALKIDELTVITGIFDRVLEKELGSNVIPANHPKRIFQIFFEKDNKEVIHISKEKGHASTIKTRVTLDKGVLFLDDPYIIDELSDNTEPVWVFNRFSHRANLEERLLDNRDKDSVISEIIGKGNWEELNDILNNMCGGKLEQTTGTRYRYVTPSLREPLSIESLSTGLKSILTLKTLFENGSMNKIGLLVVDEPEVHLHPEWQFQLARIMVLLPKVINVKVLLSTHSTDFLSALEYYSKYYQMEKKTKYYQAWKEGEYSIVAEVTEQLEKIYQDLSAPFLRVAEKI